MQTLSQRCMLHLIALKQRPTIWRIQVFSMNHKVKELRLSAWRGRCVARIQEPSLGAQQECMRCGSLKLRDYGQCTNLIQSVQQQQEELATNSLTNERED